jgi:hypothetical protein
LKTGQAVLPLHGGKAPRWLFERMVRLARGVALAVVETAGPLEFLRRLSDPFWFQAFGCVLGFDWHSSGVTTTVCGALKEALAGLERETGLHAAGGKGAAARRTPAELAAHCGRLGRDPGPLVYASRMSAKVDNTAVQDGYSIYHHSFFFLADGTWSVVQQGMNEETRLARRYHWLSEKVEDFVCEPHAAVCAPRAEERVLNMVARESGASREASARLARENPERLRAEIGRAATLVLPRRHGVRREDIDSARLASTLLRTYELQPAGFEALLGIEGVGPKTVRALALLGEIIHGAAPSFRDPARFSFAHGGKDGYPYPVDRATYDRSVEFLREAVRRAKIGQPDRLRALRALDRGATPPRSPSGA